MKTDPVEQIIATRADFWIVEMAQPENHSSNDELQRYAINRDFVEDFPYARFGNVRFRETSKYSHRYGQTCSTYVIGTAHACGLVEGTLARDRGELVARSKNTRGGRYIVYIYIYISKEIVIKTCYKTSNIYFLLRPSSGLRIGRPVGFRKRPFLRIFTRRKRERESNTNRKTNPRESSFLVRWTNFLLSFLKFSDLLTLNLPTFRVILIP